MPGGRELGADGVDEEARLGAVDGGGGEETGGGEEVRDELDEDERLGEFGGLRGGVVWRGLGPTVGYRRDLRCRDGKGEE